MYIYAGATRHCNLCGATTAHSCGYLLHSLTPRQIVLTFDLINSILLGFGAAPFVRRISELCRSMAGLVFFVMLHSYAQVHALAPGPPCPR